MNVLHPFLGGMSVMAFLVAAAFFFRFWRDSRDRFFALFSAAFVVMAGNRTLAIVFDVPHESWPWIYMARLAAFVLIAWAVIDKNRSRPADAGPAE